ncbi:MAG: Gfo/Idh/MocA family oxidoreductase [Anaerolineae bacterium]|nr:Gfo/Idh/MocA family oxidoreductase [Anaerolineae bacterium]
MTFALGLVGCGGMGRRHVLGMSKLLAAGQMRFELAAVCDVLPANGERLADQARDLLGKRPDVYTDLAAMLRAVKLDGLLVTTTPETHINVAFQAFASGLDVMIEKPITLTVAEGVGLVDAARHAGRTLAVAENYRRDPINRLGKALVDNGMVGRPFLATQASSSAGEFVIITPWRHRKDRGGIVIDMGVHYTDILEFYLGPIDSVFGMSAIVDAERKDADGKLHPADAEDLSVGVMRFRSGALVNWLLSMAGRGESFFSRVIYGTNGSIAIPGDRTGKPIRLVQRQAGKDVEIPQDELLRLLPDFCLDATTAALFGSERLTTYDLAWADIDANLLAIEQADFVDAIIQGRQPEVTGEMGLRSLALVFGLLEAERLGQVITLDAVLRRRDLPYEMDILKGSQP